MRRNITLLFLALSALSLSAEPVDRNTAFREASAFMSQRGIALSQSSKTSAFRAPARNKVDCAYYVFNADNKQGFVVVAGDDAVEPILGYADKGEFRADSVPEGLSYLLDSYSSQIVYLRLHPAMKVATITHNAISPLVTTSWDQGTPYNLYCPTVAKEKSRSYTGCVATAMAQVMYFHRWPTSSTAAIPAYSYTYDENTTVDVDGASSTVINWEAMKPYYGDDSTSEGAKAVAQLMVLAGKSVQMVYSSYSSGASASAIPYALKTYFNYDDSTRYITRSDFTNAQWDSIVYNELVQQRPVILSGTSIAGTYSNGHAFVCDGCDSNGLYHINWGWGGYSNGYFRLALLNPDGEGAGGIEGGGGYSINQGAVVGIQSDKGSSYTEDVVMTVSDFSSTTTTAKTIHGLDYSIPLTGGCYNMTSSAQSFAVNLQLYNENGDKMKSMSLATMTEYSIGYGCYLDANFKIPAKTADGTYYIKVTTKSANSTSFSLAKNANVYYVKVVIANSVATMTNYGPAVSAANMQVEGNLQVGSVQEITADFTNSGTSNVGEAYLFCDDERITGAGMNIDPGTTSQMTFNWTPSSEGTYTLSLTTDADGKSVVSSTQVTIGAAKEYKMAGEFAIENAKDTVIQGTTIQGTMTLTNNSSSDFNDIVTIYPTYRSGGHLYYYTLSSQRVKLAAGASTQISFSFPDMEDDLNYVMVATYMSLGKHTSIIDKHGYILSTSQGIEQVTTSDSSTDAGSTFNLQGVRMPEGQLPAGIYIRNGKKFVVK
jgi:hypothetical protein